MRSISRYIFLLIVGIGLLVGGCMNMPTQPAQIPGAHTTTIRYQDYTCDQLAAEYNSLSRRESKLVTAQKNRIETSRIQAFWWGYGQGDGIAASELAEVRGQMEAIREVLEKKNCSISIVEEEQTSEKAE